MCFFGLVFLLEVQEHLVHSKKSPSSSSCCLLKWRPRLPLDFKHLLLISQTTSSHFSWHTGPGAYGGCSSCWTICHNGHNMRLGPWESVICLPWYFLLSNTLFHYVQVEATPCLCVMWSVRATLVLLLLSHSVKGKGSLFLATSSSHPNTWLGLKITK